MNIKLFFEALLKFSLGLILIGLLIFVPANTIKYWNGWLFIALLFIPMFIAGLIMIKKSPNLLRSRLNAKENEGEQRVVVSLSALMFIIGFIVAGLNYRFSFIALPNEVVVLSSVVFIIAYIIYAVVLKENEFLSRTIEVQNNQKVIESGLYSIVRHPMYMATIFLFLAMPLILGSIISFLIFLFYPFIIAKRIENEEEVLEKNLKGYKEYKNKVKYRMIPFVW